MAAARCRAPSAGGRLPPAPPAGHQNSSFQRRQDTPDARRATPAGCCASIPAGGRSDSGKYPPQCKHVRTIRSRTCHAPDTTGGCAPGAEAVWDAPRARASRWARRWDICPSAQAAPGDRPGVPPPPGGSTGGGAIRVRRRQSSAGESPARKALAGVLGTRSRHRAVGAGRGSSRAGVRPVGGRSIQTASSFRSIPPCALSDAIIPDFTVSLCRYGTTGDSAAASCNPCRKRL